MKSLLLEVRNFKKLQDGTTKLAEGDVVSQVSASGFTFQPASGVVVCITTFISTGNTYLQGRGNINTGTSYITRGAGDANYTHDGMNYWVWGRGGDKFFIDNSSYVNFVRSSGYVGFTGIQVS